MLVQADTDAASTCAPDERPDLAAGDPRRLEALVARHWAAAYHLALPLTGDPAAAEDAAQDAFVRVLEQASRFDPRRAFRPWLLRIVRNVALDQRRARERRARHEARAPEAARPLGVDPALAEERARVRALVAALPHDLRDALCVRYVGGLSLAEAADALECPEGTVSSRVRRGLEALRQALGPAAASLVPDALGTIRELAVPAAPAASELAAAAEALRATAVASAAAKTAATASAAGAAAKGAAATAPLRMALAGVPLLLLAAGGAAALLRPDEAPRPAAPVVALAPPASLEVLAPAALAVGDRAQVVVRGAGDAPTVRGSGGLAVAAPRRAGDAWTVEVTAERPGPAQLLAARAGASADEVRASVHVRPRLVAARVVGNVELEGPEASASVTLEPRARLLRGPRAVRLRALPGLAAEVALSLQGFARAPTGCFEQTTAATYPSALVLELAQGDERPDDALVAHAQACAAAGAERLRRFQEPDGSFSVYGDGRRDPWITAVGLGELVHLSRVVPLERSRIDRAAEALLRWREPDGRFAPGARTAPGRELAHTAYCAWALLVAGRPAEELEPTLVWLEARLQGAAGLPAYDLAHAARALLLDPTRAAAARAALDALAAQAHVSSNPDVPPWEPSTTLTRSSAGAVEAAALAAQVLLGTDHAALAERALTWLAAQRVDGGFGSRGERLDTQATVQALEAFRRGAATRRAARGRLSLGDRTVDVAPPALVELELVARGADEAAVDALLARGLSLRWSGVGRLAVQLVVEGEVEPDSPLLADPGEARLVGLKVRVDRPLVGQVGEPQRWTVRVANEGAAPVAAPMVELELPGGFELGPDDGGLEALRRAGVLALFERREEGLALYLHDLAPRAELVVPFVVVPGVAGDFASGTLRAYPYYAARGGVVLAPETLAVAAAGSSAPSYGPPPPPPPRSDRSAPRAARATGAGPTRDAGEVAGDVGPSGGPAVFRVGAETGRNDPVDRLARAPALLLDPLDTTDPLADLLSPLLQGSAVGMSNMRQAGRWIELSLDRERAVDAEGRPITADMIAGAWAAARAAVGRSPLRSPVEWEALRMLVGMKVEVLSTWTLRVLPPEGIEDGLRRLSLWPLRVGPFPPLAGSALLVSAGPYRLTRCDPDGLLLVRRPPAASAEPAPDAKARGPQGPATVLVTRFFGKGDDPVDRRLARAPQRAAPLGLRVGAALRQRLGDGGLATLRRVVAGDPEPRLSGALRVAFSGPRERAAEAVDRLVAAGLQVELLAEPGFGAEPDLFLGLLPRDPDQHVVLEPLPGAPAAR